MVGRDTNSYLFRTVHAEVDGLPYVDLRARNELTYGQESDGYIIVKPARGSVGVLSALL